MPHLCRRGFLLLPAALLPGCSAGATGDISELRVATGPAGGPYAQFGSRFAAELRRSGFAVRVLPTAGSVVNLSMLADGRADLGFALADSAADAVEAGRPVTALARVYLNYVHLVVPAYSSLTAPAQLTGKAVSIGAKGSGTAVSAARVLSAAGLPGPAHLRWLDLAESIDALDKERIEAFFWSGGVSTPALADYAARAPIRLVPLGTLVPALRRVHGPVYEHATVPAGEYGTRAPVPTVGTPSYLVCPPRLPGRVARAITEVLFDSRDRLEAPHAPGGTLDVRYAIGTGAVPLHEGAAQYYRSAYG
ncbi:TAXI family TRAP transporter solute-binding subunit [Sinosporangium siamense]|uniref:C4-dicarboxylate ABC transporter substrate-binding protein n=1 Tax=Sinosporangium siamense TaxID=1367973 RepID=A0A919V9Z2_9ACTN|nr:TAXI family TRAP transporter solute-binding subunit [Sinosporangium siamense]GII95913.1 C4-dicarboxylate ABC transporter substrate-binding protein [Sinosporangium siamense]